MKILMSVYNLLLFSIPNVTFVRPFNRNYLITRAMISSVEVRRQIDK